ncbi:MAG: type II toxin-antitoxin system HicA family toxin [Lachnospiraceae bacterium]|nr:type II toxin-antitoxin system HicA family toxin [Lachnospiraceae bacterium]
MTFREIEKILRADNWTLIRVTGSHYQYRKVGVANAVVVPNHNGKDISIGVVKDLEKKTGLSLRR